MADRSAYVRFFYSPPVNKNQQQADALADKYMGKIPLSYFQAAFKFFYSPPVNKNVDQAIALVEKWGMHRLGAIPLASFAEVLFKFFYAPPVNKNVDQALDLVVKFYEMTEADGWLPSYDELIKDVPNFFKFFYSPPVNKNVDQALQLCERVVKGVGRVNLEAFKNAYNASYKTKNVDQSLADAFSAVGL